MSDADFTMLRPDSKGRISVGKLTPPGVSGFRAHTDKDGKIILEPYAEIPAREAWLYKNREALESVLRGIEQSAAGEVVHRGSFAQYADDDIE